MQQPVAALPARHARLSRKESLMPRPNCGTIDVDTHKDGQQTFYLRMTVDGRRRRVRLGTDRAGWTMGKAMIALEEQLATVRIGTWRPPDEPDARSEADAPTFRTFASSWLEDNLLEWRPNTVNDVRWRLQSHLLLRIGEDRLSTFDIPRVTAVKTAMLRESRRSPTPSTRVSSSAMRTTTRCARCPTSRSTSAWRCWPGSSMTPSSAATWPTTPPGACAACATTAPGGRCSKITSSTRCSRPPIVSICGEPISASRSPRSPRYVLKGTPTSRSPITGRSPSPPSITA